MIDEASRRIIGYFSKPSFDPFTLLRIDYLGQPAAIRRELLMTARREGRVYSATTVSKTMSSRSG